MLWGCGSVGCVWASGVCIFVNGYRVGFGCVVFDLDLGCGKVLWISGNMVGICLGFEVVEKLRRWIETGCESVFGVVDFAVSL